MRRTSAIGTIRTLLVDDSVAFLTSLHRFLADHPRVRVVGAATSGHNGVAEAVRLRPDLVLLDLVMPGMTGLEALRWIKAVPHPPRVLVLTFQNEPEFRDRAIALGADGFVTKAELARHLMHAVEARFPEGGEAMSEFGMPEYVEGIFATAREMFVLLDDDLRIRAANRAFYDTFRVTRAETEGRLLYELCAGRWDIPALRLLLEEVIHRDGQVRDFEVEHDFPGLGRRTVLLNARRVTQAGGSGQRILLAFEDVTEKGQARVEASHLADIVRSSADAIIGQTREGTITSRNPVAERLDGWTAAEAVGQPISLIVPTDRREESAGVMDRLPRGELVQHHQTHRVRRDGSWVDASLPISPVRDASGRLVGVPESAGDITERTRWESAVQASEARFRALFENSWDGVTLLDADGVIRYASPATTRVLGYVPEESVGRPAVEFVHPDDRPAVAEVIAGAASGRSAILSYRSRHKNGSWVRVETAATNLLDDPHIRAVVLNSRDVTEAVAAAEALRQSEEQHRALAESIPNLVWVYRPDGTPEYFNRRWTEYTGVSAADLAAGTRPEIVHPDDRPRMQEVWERALRDGQLYEIEYRLRRADGAYRWHIGRAVPVRDPEGRVVRWFGTCTDIHDGRRAEDERSRLARHIRLLLESTGEGIYGFDHEGRCTFINQAGAAMLGYTPDELIGREMHAVIHHHWPDGTPYPSGECPIYTAFREGRGVRVEDELLWRKDGTSFPVSFTSCPAADGGFRGAVVTFQDATERRQAEAALRLRDRAIRAVPQGILITDATQADNPIIYASPGFELLTGYTAAEVAGRNCRFLQGPDTDREVVTRVRTAVQDGEACLVEVLNYRKDGTPFWNELSISPVRDEGGRLTHFVGVQADVTARRRMEEQYRQAQKMEALGQLAGGIAHDFNNLLTIINGYSDLLLQSLPTADPSRDLLAEIHRAGERSAGLTRQLLAFSRRQVLAPRVLDLNAVVADTEKMLRRMIGEDVRLATAPSPGLWPVRADPGQIEQVLLNLAVNARDAMPTGGRLTIETRNVELDDEYARIHPGARPGPHILLAVSDTGCGMTDEVKARIFEPFFTTKGPGKGTGLGLATVYGIVSQSGGHVGVYSEAGVGTTFKVYLPRAEGPVGGSKLRPGVLVPPRGAETVLLVEDDPGVRALTRHILAGCGYTVLEASDGDEAARAAARHTGPIHLLVTDVVMPGGGGWSVAERLLARHPGLKVLYVSGYTDDAVVRHGVLTEQANFLQKPFTPITLAVKVREVLDQPK